jgi:hypothetical protein
MATPNNTTHSAPAVKTPIPCSDLRRARTLQSKESQTLTTDQMSESEKLEY